MFCLTKTWGGESLSKDIRPCYESNIHETQNSDLAGTFISNLFGLSRLSRSQEITFTLIRNDINETYSY